MSKQWNESTATAKGLYDPRYEHDNCGIGAVVNIKGIKTHETVENALKIVENLKHRAGKDADGKTNIEKNIGFSKLFSMYYWSQQITFYNTCNNRLCDTET